MQLIRFSKGIRHLCKDGLQKGIQTRVEEALQRRAPQLSETQRILNTIISVHLFKAILPLLLQAKDAERELLLHELKTALYRYLEPLLRESD